MSDRGDLHANPDVRDLNGVTLWEGLQALEAHERGEGRICNANVIARAFGTLQVTAHPNNVTLENLGAFDRKTKIDKHTSTNWGYLRRMIDRLDAAGQSDVADVLIWQVWWRVNTEARRSELHRLDVEAIASAHAQHVAAEDRAEAAEAEALHLREVLKQISGQYVTNRGDMAEAESLATIKRIADRALLAEDGE